jgi:hypothetical protein
MKPLSHFSNRTTVSRILGSLSAAVGLFVLIGWALGIPWIKSVLPGAKANTAVGLLLAGVALCLLDVQSSRRRRWIRPDTGVGRRIPGLRQLGRVCRWVAKRSGGRETPAMQAAALDSLVHQRIT